MLLAGTSPPITFHLSRDPRSLKDIKRQAGCLPLQSYALIHIYYLTLTHADRFAA